MSAQEREPTLNADCVACIAKYLDAENCCRATVTNRAFDRGMRLKREVVVDDSFNIKRLLKWLVSVIANKYCRKLSITASMSHNNVSYVRAIFIE